MFLAVCEDDLFVILIENGYALFVYILSGTKDSVANSAGFPREDMKTLRSRTHYLMACGPSERAKSSESFLNFAADSFQYFLFLSLSFVSNT